MTPSPRHPDAATGVRRVLFVGSLTALLTAAMMSPGCDTISEDFNDFMQGISPPSPFEAAVWAADFSDPGQQRRGVVLLSNATFGGETPYLELYRTLVQESPDPLVRAAAIRALGRWGTPEDAQIIAGAARLGDPESIEAVPVPVRLESAISLQRLHETAIVDRIWRQLINEDENESVRVELAIALGQYPTDAAFQALCLALDDRSLALNLAAADSLRVMTGHDFGIDAPVWLSWYASTPGAFTDGETFLYPTFQRKIGFWESLAFWSPVRFEEPGPPRGLATTSRRTYGDDAERTSSEDREYQNLGEGP